MKFQDKKHHPVSEKLWDALVSASYCDINFNPDSMPSIVAVRLNGVDVFILRKEIKVAFKARYDSLYILYSELSKDILQELDEDGYIIIKKASWEDEKDFPRINLYVNFEFYDYIKNIRSSSIIVHKFANQESIHIFPSFLDQKKLSEHSDNTFNKIKELLKNKNIVVLTKLTGE